VVVTDMMRPPASPSSKKEGKVRGSRDVLALGMRCLPQIPSLKRRGLISRGGGDRHDAAPCFPLLEEGGEGSRFERCACAGHEVPPTDPLLEKEGTHFKGWW